MSADEDIIVITRTGKRESIDPNKITQRIDVLINREPKIPNVNATTLMLEVCKGLRSGMQTREIDDYSANAAASLSITNPYYLAIASRIAIDNHSKSTLRSFTDKVKKMYLNMDNNGKFNPLVSAEYCKYVEQHQDEIEKFLDYNRDFRLDYFGMHTFLKNYAMKINGIPIDRPQDMFMRIAIFLHMGSGLPIAEELSKIKETYDMLSLKKYTHASPTYYNAGTKNQQLASCFLMGTSDSLEGIMKTATDMATISKWAGGIGVHLSNLRSNGALIRGTNGKSNGLIRWMKIFEPVMRGFDQGGRRPGSAAIYLMPHHPDIMEFIESGRNTGTDDNLVRHLFLSLWVPNIFMERVKQGAMWSLFDPDTVGDLSNYTGGEYTVKYLELEEKKLYTKQIPARKIWEAAYLTNKEKGSLYICFADNANKTSMMNNIGPIKSSNLCAEIYLYSDDKEYAVCILSSVSLPSCVFDHYTEEELKEPENTRRLLNHDFPVNPVFNFQTLSEITKVATTNLNIIVDKTICPVKEASRGNQRHRPIGIGVQGLDDCYAKMRYPFESAEARELNMRIFETMYFAATSQSSKLARKDYQRIVTECKTNGSVIVPTYSPAHYDIEYVKYTNPDDIPTTIGSYPSMTWNGGSHLFNGKFHWELCGLSESKLKCGYDWDTLRDHIRKFGVKNCVTIACMPTASTSQLLGNNECIEPYTSNIYKRSTSAGEFLIVKKYLINDLYKLNLWNKNIRDYLLSCNGSIQYIEGLPDSIKKLYPTVWEIPQNELVQQAIDRQPFVDQGQSFNIYSENMSQKEWNSIMFKGWQGGLKTGKYYLHSRAAADPQKFTVDPVKQEEILKIMAKNKMNVSIFQPTNESCDVCSG